ncbi:hypothetical protein MPDQ_002610 [Monascus purpureus]|uniref:Glycerol-3-phosphate dehydrogenase n=1 Tax=Monascus purpureus TaxID=5098 RepID=A0A507QPA9_MONPU|nr:hypothetical protein MPDQ_002610 [Monascus purpureus]BDD61831.1 hypothetical protein MAP00_006855 [Monascus purpureus]
MAASRLFSRRALRNVAAVSTLATGGAVTYYAFFQPSFSRGGSSLTTTVIPTQFPRLKSREEQLADLRHSSNNAQQDEYDLLIIGGGATGTGIALDAVTRGLKVALVERGDFSCGTSSKSTKLVHGGIRYLEKAVKDLDYEQYKLVRAALHERRYFLNIAPHLSTELPLVLPVRKWWEAPYLWVGTKMYDALAGSEALNSSYFLTKDQALDAIPTLNQDNMVGAIVYYDGQHNDSRMNVSLATTAAFYGATVLNYVEVTGLEKDATGKLCGANVKDVLSADGKPFTVRAKGVINATGPFADAIHQMDEPAKTSNVVAPSSGVHIVLPSWLSPKKDHGVIDASSDGRVLFLLPWEGKLVAGTTDNPCAIERDPIPQESDVDFILNELKRILSPKVDLQRSDVLAVWSGIRPLVRDPNAANTESLARTHLITLSPSGLLSCVGGKWTTYREMAEDTVDRAIDVFGLRTGPLRSIPDISGTGSIEDGSRLDGSCQTRNVRLVGAHGYSKTLFVDLLKHYPSIEQDIAEHLAHNYGDRAWDVASSSSSSKGMQFQRLVPTHPFTDAEVRYAVRNEYAQTAADFLARRTRLSFLDVKAAKEALPKVIDLMGEELHWSKAKKQSEYKETLHFLKSMGLSDDA